MTGMMARIIAAMMSEVVGVPCNLNFVLCLRIISALRTKEQ